jgi:hypothetical protein
MNRLILPLTILSLCLVPAAVRADEAEDKAEAAIKKLGGSVYRDPNKDAIKIPA